MRDDPGPLPPVLWRRGPALVLMVLLPAGQSFAETVVYVEGETFTYSESLSVEALLDSGRGGTFTRGGDVTFTHNQGAVGVTAQKFGATWDLALLTRYDLRAEYDPDAAELLYASTNNQPIADGEYGFDIRAKEIRARGIRLGVEMSPTRESTIGFHVTALEADQLLDGRTSGLATLTDGDTLEGLVAIDYRYTKDLLFDRDPEETTGHGATVDIHGRLQATEKTAVSVVVKDIWSEIRWGDAEKTIADATTANTSVGADGLLIVRPLLQGQRETADYKQRYSARIAARIDHALNETWTASQSLVAFEDEWFSTTTARYKLSETLSLQAQAEWTQGAVGVGVSWRGIEAAITTDAINPADAQYLSATLRGSIQF